MIKFSYIEFNFEIIFVYVFCNIGKKKITHLRVNDQRLVHLKFC